MTEATSMPGPTSVTGPALVVRARRLRAARGVVVARNVSGQAALLGVPGIALVIAAAFLVTRLT